MRDRAEGMPRSQGEPILCLPVLRCDTIYQVTDTAPVTAAVEQILPDLDQRIIDEKVHNLSNGLSSAAVVMIIKRYRNGPKT